MRILLYRPYIYFLARLCNAYSFVNMWPYARHVHEDEKMIKAAETGSKKRRRNLIARIGARI